MSFLPNENDPILDVSLTTKGRELMAKGDLKITKFSFGDDEIDYGLVNLSHPSGSAYADINVLSTPLFEAGTNDKSGLMYKLITLTDPNLLYLPDIRVNTQISPFHSSETFVVVGNNDAYDEYTNTGSTAITSIDGFIDGRFSKRSSDNLLVRVDQGFLGANEYGDNEDELPPEFVETEFEVHTNGLFLNLVDPNGVRMTPLVEPGFLSNKNPINRYIISKNSDPQFFEASSKSTVFNGPISLDRMRFALAVSSNLATNYEYWSNLYGVTETVESVSVSSIDTSIKIVGKKFGRELNIPIKLVLKV